MANQNLSKYASLTDLNAYYGAKKPTASGTGSDYQATKSYYDDYLNDLEGYASTNGESDSFDYSTWKLYRDYANEQASSADTALVSYLATEKAAQESKITQESIREQAMKRASASLEANGLGSQGISQTYQAGIGNQYASNVSAIDTQKAEDKTTLLKEYQAEASAGKRSLDDTVYSNAQASKDDAFSMAAQLISTATSQEEIDKVLGLYGNKLTSEQRTVLDYQIAQIAKTGTNITTGLNETDASAVNAIKLGNTKAVASGQTLDAFLSSADTNMSNPYSAVDKQGDSTMTSGYGFKDELTDVWNEIKGYGANQNGTVFQLTNSTHGTKVYLVYYNGAIYQTSEEAFKASSKTKSNTGGKWDK